MKENQTKRKRERKKHVKEKFIRGKEIKKGIEVNDTKRKKKE